MEDKITIDDVMAFEHLFSTTPSFILERMAKKKTNLVKKFEDVVRKHLAAADDNEMRKLNIAINTEIDELQATMAEAYRLTNKKQFKILANPDNKEFLELNRSELRKIVNGEN